MKQLSNIKKKLPLFLLIGIIIICSGFILINCGKGPQQKVVSPDAGAFAIDFSDCPSPILCRAIIDSSEFSNSPDKHIAGKELTLEAWVKPHSTSSAAIFGRMDSAGAALFFSNQKHPTTTASFTSLKFAIRRVAIVPISVLAPNGTSTIEHIVDSGVDISTILDQWTHIAGILVNKDHTAVHADCLDYSKNPAVVTHSARADKPHIDIYVDGQYKNCARTFGETTVSGDPDDASSPAFAHDPGGNIMVVGAFGDSGGPIDGVVSAGTPLSGKVDEVRLWASDRTDQIVECKDVELGSNSGTCGRLTNKLVAYFRFNEGTNTIVTDWAGLGAGGKEYPNENPPPEVKDWITGWTTDVPLLQSAD